MPTGGENCIYCYDAPALPEQFYETKLFRVLIARRAFAPGHVVIIPKRHDPHFYSFTPDDIEELGYLVKKVSFWAMLWVHGLGFSLTMNDSTPETRESNHLEIHIVPRGVGDAEFARLDAAVEQARHVLDEGAIAAGVAELRNLMQLPQ